MAANRVLTGGVRVAALAGLFAGFQAVVVIEAMALARPATPAALPVEAPVALVRVPADATAPLSAATRPPETFDLPTPAVDPPAPADSVDPMPSVTLTDSPPTATTEPMPADRPAPELPASRRTAEQLQSTLLRVPEVWLQPPTVPTVPRTGRTGNGVHPLLAVLDARPDLRGLPARREPDVRLSRTDAEAFRDASVLLRKGLGEWLGQDSRPNRRLIIRPEVLSARPQIVARLLHQMLQVESVPLRKQLISELKQMHDPAASRLLAHRAVYEPVAELRQIAVQALAERQVTEFLPVLLDALGSLWPPAADHAADALTALAPTDAVPELIYRLDGPDPSAGPTDDHGAPSVRELVRVNHARNCLLCHAQSVSSRDGIRVAAPNPQRPLPSPFSLANYEGGGKGGSRADPNTVFVRPDITYLRQDFSWVLPVANPGPWPALQRYDFLVRTRPAGKNEAAAANADSPQKRAVVRALRSLTGKDFGDRAADWRAGLAVALKGG